MRKTLKLNAKLIVLADPETLKPEHRSNNIILCFLLVV